MLLRVLTNRTSSDLESLFASEHVVTLSMPDLFGRLTTTRTVVSLSLLVVSSASVLVCYGLLKVPS